MTSTAYVQDEGFRIVEVETTKADSPCFGNDVRHAIRDVDPLVPLLWFVRDIRGLHVVVGESWGGQRPGSPEEEARK